MGLNPIGNLELERELISRVRLNATDCARVCGVTVRQLGYWTDKGIITPVEGTTRTYEFAAAEKAALIRETMEEGYTLERAADMVDRRLAARKQELERTKPMGAQELERELDRHLRDLEASIRDMRTKLPAYVSHLRLRDVMAALASIDVERLTSGANRDVGQRLARAIEGLRKAVSDAVEAGILGSGATKG